MEITESSFSDEVLEMYAKHNHYISGDRRDCDCLRADLAATVLELRKRNRDLWNELQCAIQRGL